MPKQSPTSFLSLPNELLLLIAEHLDGFQHLYDLLRANRRLSMVLAKASYRLAARSSLEFGLIALLWAAASQNESMLRVLLSASSPRITVKDQYGQTLCLVSRGRIPDADAVAQTLSECTTIGIRVKKGKRTSYEGPALHWAARIGSQVLIRLLLDKGADIRARDLHGHTALHCAAAMNQKAAVKLLLRRGAERHVVGFFGETPLDRALYYQHFDVVLILLDGADPTATYQYGLTALHVAARYPVDDIAATYVEKLLRLGADPSAVNDGFSRHHGMTPVYNAVLRGNERVVSLLLKAGAWRYLCTATGQSVLQVAIQEKHYGIARLLLESAPSHSQELDGSTLLHMAIDLPGTDLMLVTQLLDRGIPLNTGCWRRVTPLHRAVQHGYSDFVNLFVERGADIHALDDNNTNALIHAAAGVLWNHNGTYIAQHGRGTTDNMLSIARLFLEKGADIDIQDVNGRTAMHHAVIAGGEAMVRLLLQFNPDLSLVDSGWRTPMEVARANATAGDEESEIFEVLQAIFTGRRLPTARMERNTRSPVNFAC